MTTSRLEQIHFASRQPGAMSANDQDRNRGIIVAPFREGLKKMIVALAIALPIALFLSLRHEPISAWVVNSLFYKILIGVVAITAGMSFGYSYLGSKIGRAKAGNIFTVIGLAVLIGGVYWMTHAFE